MWQGDSAGALDLLHESPPSGPANAELQLRREIITGYALSAQDKSAEAEQHLLDAARLATNAPSALRAELALAEGALAWRRNDDPAAGRFYRQGLDLAREAHDPFLEANALGSLGLVATETGHYDEAVEWHIQSLRVARAAKSNISAALTLVNLGWSYLELGDLDKATPLLEEARKLSSSAGLKSAQGLLLHNICAAYLDRHDYSSAERYCRGALDLSRSLNPKGAAAAVDLNNLAESLLGENKLDAAAAANEESMAILLYSVEPLITAGRIAAARRDFPRAQQLLLRAGARARNKALRWGAEAALANLYVLEHRDGQADAQFQKVIRTFTDARSALHDDESKLAFSFRAADFYSDYIHFLVGRKRVPQALQVAEFARSRTLEEGLGIPPPRAPGDIHLGPIQRVLRGRNQSALFYWLDSAGSLGWVVTPATIELFQLPPKQEIEELVRSYNSTLLAAGNTRPLGQQLYRMLVEPARSQLPPGATVAIVADGELSRLNFETLVVPGEPAHYWIEDVEIENAGSLELLAPNNHPPAATKGLLLVGNPVQVDPDFPALRYAEQEMADVATHFPGTTVILSGNQATPSSYAAHHPERFRFIHFVTHGTASEVSPLDSAIILSPDRQQYKLYAREIVKTHLNADLVTVSACYGAGTRAYSGEGLVGLAWAFLRAGAREVVAGLWDVSDLSTPRLMDQFYAGIQKGLPAASALRSAKLDMLHSATVYKHPLYWASLQLYVG